MQRRGGAGAIKRVGLSIDALIVVAALCFPAANAVWCPKAHGQASVPVFATGPEIEHGKWTAIDAGKGEPALGIAGSDAGWGIWDEPDTRAVYTFYPPSEKLFQYESVRARVVYATPMGSGAPSLQVGAAQPLTWVLDADATEASRALSPDRLGRAWGRSSVPGLARFPVALAVGEGDACVVRGASLRIEGRFRNVLSVAAYVAAQAELELEGITSVLRTLAQNGPAAEVRRAVREAHRDLGRTVTSRSRVEGAVRSGNAALDVLDKVNEASDIAVEVAVRKDRREAFARGADGITVKDAHEYAGPRLLPAAKRLRQALLGAAQRATLVKAGDLKKALAEIRRTAKPKKLARLARGARAAQGADLFSAKSGTGQSALLVTGYELVETAFGGEPYGEKVGVEAAASYFDQTTSRILVDYYGRTGEEEPGAGRKAPKQ